MKYVLAFVAPDRLDPLIEELADHHVRGLTVSEARGFGQEHDASHPEHRDHEGVDLVRKLRIEVVCADAEIEELLAAFYKVTHTGRRGDGKVFVLAVEDALRLKTGERGDAALGPRQG
jgi:nitrogen regulatory protein P-II 1